MGMWTADSDQDYVDEPRHGVEYVCPTCHRTFWIPKSEGYPGANPQCDACLTDAWVDEQETRTQAFKDGQVRRYLDRVVNER